MWFFLALKIVIAFIILHYLFLLFDSYYIEKFDSYNYYILVLYMQQSDTTYIIFIPQFFIISLNIKISTLAKSYL